MLATFSFAAEVEVGDVAEQVLEAGAEEGGVGEAALEF